VSYSVKTLLKATGSVALVLALCLALLGLVGCGGDDLTTTTLQTGTTLPGGTATTTGDASTDTTVLTGKWYCERIKETFEFSSDGKMIWTKDGQTPQTFPFTVKEGAIVFNQSNAATANNLPFTVSGDSLTTMDPKYGRLTYTKQ
jgi:hypothetical protein